MSDKLTRRLIKRQTVKKMYGLSSLVRITFSFLYIYIFCRRRYANQNNVVKITISVAKEPMTRTRASLKSLSISHSYEYATQCCFYFFFFVQFCFVLLLFSRRFVRSTRHARSERTSLDWTGLDGTSRFTEKIKRWWSIAISLSSSWEKFIDLCVLTG